MSKQMEAGSAQQAGFTMPSAPPSYDDAMAQKQPAYNPQFIPQQHVAGPAPAVQPPPLVYPPQSVPYTPVATVAVSVGPKPCTIMCPHCHQTVRTEVRYECQKTAHLAALILCLLQCYLCCCIPYCLDSFKNVHHKCPNCRAFIGTFQH